MRHRAAGALPRAAVTERHYSARWSAYRREVRRRGILKQEAGMHGFPSPGPWFIIACDACSPLHMIPVPPPRVAFSGRVMVLGTLPCMPVFGSFVFAGVHSAARR